MTTQVQILARLNPRLIYAMDTLSSLAMGAALLATAGPLTQLAGWALPPAFLLGVGLFLLPWAAFNLWIVRSVRPARTAVMANIVGDIVWVGGTAVLAAVQAPSLSGIGLALLVGQGVAVGAVLVIKLIGARALVQ